MIPETRAWLTLTLTPGLGPTLIARLIEHAGSVERAVNLTAAQLAEITGISDKGAGKHKRAIDATAGDTLQREIDLIYKHGATLLSLDDPAYPALLKQIPSAPPLLWVKGRLDPADSLSLAIVGSRKCSHYGREQADLIANALARSGVTIVSGGAYGIDIAAHRGALRAAKAGMGRTIAVLGSGLAKPYPIEHVDVFKDIVEGDGEHGSVISEFPMTAGPRPENFLRRNRIISGLCVGTLVVEASKRSGALSTARRCVDEQDRILMALPGRVDAPQSEGCHQIIREQWGSLVTGVSDILDALGETGSMLDAATEQSEQVSKPEPSSNGKSIVEILDTPRSLDEIVNWTGLPAAKVQTELTMLEIRGAIARQGGLFVKRRV
ncbi:MAG: DNA-processing protein DprA [Planctomycetota bacterium]